jgi:hypothetical protein
MWYLTYWRSNPAEFCLFIVHFLRNLASLLLFRAEFLWDFWGLCQFALLVKIALDGRRGVFCFAGWISGLFETRVLFLYWSRFFVEFCMHRMSLRVTPEILDVYGFCCCWALSLCCGRRDR